MTRHARTLAASAALLAGLATAPGCAPDRPASAARAATTAHSVAIPRPPANETCRVLDGRDVSARSNDDPAVRCSAPHTAQTFFVGRWPAALLRAVSGASDRRLATHAARICADRLPDFLGDPGSESIPLGAVSYAWFGPAAPAFAAGADWFRCDAVAYDPAVDRPRHRLLLLPPDIAGMVRRGPIPDRLALCHTADPFAGRGKGEMITCDRPHHLRAVAAAHLPETHHLPGERRLDDLAAQACRIVLGPDAPRFAYTPMTADEFAGGSRRVRCWTREVSVRSRR